MPAFILAATRPRDIQGAMTDHLAVAGQGEDQRDVDADPFG